jgi:2-polyprenyl-3-methyl-5-hydroxy-6-metoxy-1,4-benzoquinol methylase
MIKNIINNKKFYDDYYENVSLEPHLKLINNFNSEFLRLKSVHLGWHMLFSKLVDLNNKNVLEIGAGDCHYAIGLSNKGAQVSVNDISVRTREIAEKLNELSDGRLSLKIENEDILKNKFSIDFDLIIGVAIIHHLEEDLELQIIEKLTNNLISNGRMIFIEPLENSMFLKFFKNLFPSENRPSILRYNAFKNYRKNFDPHPIRDNSSKHYLDIARKLGLKCEIEHYGFIYQFVKFFPSKKAKFIEYEIFIRKFYIGRMLNYHLGQAQIVEFRKVK